MSRLLLLRCATRIGRRPTFSSGLTTARFITNHASSQRCFSSSSISLLPNEDDSERQDDDYSSELENNVSQTNHDDGSNIQRQHRERPSSLTLGNIIDGPPIRFGTGTLATLTESSVVGTAGKTVVLSTVAVNHVDDTDDNEQSLASALKAHCLARTSMVPLTVSYQERHHGVGRIPSNARRRDNLRQTDEEVLASRAIDRALRPLMTNDNNMEAIHVNCSVQAHDVWGACGNPVALALNSASVALSRAKLLQEPVASVHLCVMPDGTIIMDPTPQQVEHSLAELLYAGTKTHTIMMECNSPTCYIPEAFLIKLLRVAHAALEPIFEVQTELVDAVDVAEEEQDEAELRQALGLPPLEEDESHNKDADANKHDKDASRLFDEAYEYCQSQLKESSLRLFGYNRSGAEMDGDNTTEEVTIHPLDQPLLSKSIRGQREHLVFTEIERLLKDSFSPTQSEAEYKTLVEEDSECISILARAIHNRLLKSALVETSTQHHTRGDERGGTGKSNPCRVVRPISIAVPALPDSVHGSAIFARGDTQVLCTATLGAPVDGIVKKNPYQETTDPRTAGTEGRTDLPKGPYDDLPVGSLRYLRSQEALLSDMNSRKVKAEKEITGESGTLDEVRRFFLHYDFPSFSTGEVPGRGMAANRRAIGHGALAEKAVRSSIPPPETFPYTVRLTSEVTGSNGSSSMATVCGATLALLDAGIPITYPVAGVSVGLAVDESEGGDGSEAESGSYGLLLDITGTEDHYGAMDFKIAGTKDGVTALQLDVKRPLPLEVIEKALDLAKAGRRAMLQEMSTLSDKTSDGIISKLSPRPALKDSAPRVAVVRFDPLRKRDLIGPGGAVLRQLEERFGVALDLTQEGQCLLYGANGEMVAKARSAVMDLVADVVEGEVYEGTVIEIKDFGAIIELLRNKEGLLHVSELGGADSESHPKGNLGVVSKHLRVGQQIQVLCIGVDPVQGSIKLSQKQLYQQS